MDVLPRPRCNLNNVTEPERPENTNSLETSWFNMFCTVEKCSSSSVTSWFRHPILSSRSLTTKLNKPPRWEQNLQRQQKKNQHEQCHFNVTLTPRVVTISTCKVPDRLTHSFLCRRLGPGLELHERHFERPPR